MDYLLTTKLLEVEEKSMVQKQLCHQIECNPFHREKTHGAPSQNFQDIPFSIFAGTLLSGGLEAGETMKIKLQVEWGKKVSRYGLVRFRRGSTTLKIFPMHWQNPSQFDYLGLQVGCFTDKSSRLINSISTNLTQIQIQTQIQVQIQIQEWNTNCKLVVSHPSRLFNNSQKRHLAQ